MECTAMMAGAPSSAKALIVCVYFGFKGTCQQVLLQHRFGMRLHVYIDLDPFNIISSLITK